MKNITMSKPVYPVACNVDAEMVSDDNRAFGTLVRQVTGAVKWEQCMRLLIAAGGVAMFYLGLGIQNRT